VAASLLVADEGQRFKPPLARAHWCDRDRDTSKVDYTLDIRCGFLAVPTTSKASGRQTVATPSIDALQLTARRFADRLNSFLRERRSTAWNKPWLTTRDCPVNACSQTGKE